MSDESPIMAARRLMTPPEVARHIHVSVMTLHHWRKKSFGPDYIRFGETRRGNVIRYRPEDVERFLINSLHLCESVSRYVDSLLRNLVKGSDL